ncbi:MAG: hypothetical protein K2W96_11385, partial [Gemmataceae bacterium]|nr:hypothetical protein [Gemmataceae bacterium]
RCLLGEHHGYGLACNRGRFLAMRPGLAPGRPEDMPEAEWRRHRAEGRCFEGESLADVKRQIDRHHLDRQEETRAELERARRELDLERERVSCLAGRLHALEEKVERHRPLHVRLARWVRRFAPWLFGPRTEPARSG